LEGPEEEGFVLDDRTADRSSSLVPPEDGAIKAGAIEEEIVGDQLVVLKK
jgi:hypothetical protein